MVLLVVFFGERKWVWFLINQTSWLLKRWEGLCESGSETILCFLLYHVTRNYLGSRMQLALRFFKLLIEILGFLGACTNEHVCIDEVQFRLCAIVFLFKITLVEISCAHGLV